MASRDGIKSNIGQSNKAIFLDRDGTLNRDFGYVHKLTDWQWLPGVKDALRRLKDAGWLLIVVSNQSGIGRGYFSREDLENLQAALDRELADFGAGIDAWYYCPHVDGDDCDCRKPKAGLIARAARDWRVDVSSSWMLGDRLRDVHAGLAAGCKAGLLYNPGRLDEWHQAARSLPEVKKWQDFAKAAEFLLQR